MNASILLQQPKMMLTYPQQQAVFRPSFVSHGVVPQPVAQLPGFPMAIAPTILHAQIPQSSFATVMTTHPAKPSVDPISSPMIIKKPMSPCSTTSPKTNHNSFSIDSILGKKDTKTTSVEKIPPVSPHNSAGRTGTTNGVVYFYTPAATATTQPPCSPFPFATPRAFRSRDAEESFRTHCHSVRWERSIISVIIHNGACACISVLCLIKDNSFDFKEINYFTFFLVLRWLTTCI